MRILSIALKDLQVFFADRGALFYLFILPLVFIFLFATLASGQVPSSETEKVPLVVANLDPNGAASSQLIARLEDSAGIQVIPYTVQEASDALSRFKINRYLLIPERFSAALSEGQPVELLLYVHPNASSRTNETVQRSVNGVGKDLSLQTQILSGLRQMGNMQAGSTSGQIFTAERLVAQAQSQFDRSRSRPLVAIQQVNAKKQEAESPATADDFMVTSVAGATVLFVFLASQGVARSIFDEKRSGSFRRLLAAPLNKMDILGGKLLPNLLLTLLQVLVIFLVGGFAFAVIGWGRLPILQSLPAWLAASFVVALCSTSLGIFLASLARTDAQVGGYSTVALWISGMIGGSFIPSFMMPSFIQGIARFVPHYWANNVYYNVLVFGQSLSQIAPSLGVLMVFTIVFFTIGMWKFRYE